jgi:hypothetical protein
MRSLTKIGIGLLTAVAMGAGAVPALASNDPSPGGANPIPACGLGNGPYSVPVTAQTFNGVGNAFKVLNPPFSSVGQAGQYDHSFIFPYCGSNEAPPSQTPPLPGGTN